MYVSLFDRYHFYGVLDQADDELAGQIRQRVGAGGVPDTPIGIANWAGYSLGQRGRRLREAIEESKWIALRNLKAKLGGIKLDDIWPLLLEICHDMALYIGGSAIAGAVVGAFIGSAGLGVGAVPGAVAGTAAGAEIGQMLLGFFGLKSVIEYMLDKLPVAIDEYRKGFLVAWGPMPSMHDMFSEQPASSYNFESNAMAAGNFARGHEIIIMALLMGIVTYLGRSKGNLKALMAEASSHSKLGPKFATWLEQNERELSASPVLRDQRSGDAQAGSQAPSAGMAPGQRKSEAAKAAAHEANKVVMRSPSELMGVEPASAELLMAVGGKRTLEIAQPGSEALRMLDYFGAEASVGGELNSSILLRQNPSKAAVLEEFLHGTQARLGIVDRLGASGFGSAETHVKDFMVRHQSILGLSAEDVRILKILRDKGL
jgi:hypothetical protein